MSLDTTCSNLRGILHEIVSITAATQLHSGTFAITQPATSNQYGEAEHGVDPFPAGWAGMETDSASDEMAFFPSAFDPHGKAHGHR